MFAHRLIRIPTRAFRGFATQASLTPTSALPATLHLKSGQSFAGKSFGAQRSIYGETVFSTSITSCEYASNTLVHAYTDLSRQIPSL